MELKSPRVVHASITTTLNIYTHVVDASHRKAVEALEERLFGDLDPKWTQIGDRAENAVAAKWA